MWEDLDSLKRYNARKVFPNNKVHAADIVNFRKNDFTIDEGDDTDVVCFFAKIKESLGNNEVSRFIYGIFLKVIEIGVRY